MFDFKNTLWRQGNGMRCLSMIEVSLTLSVLTGLLFVSIRVMSMEASPRSWQASATEVSTTRLDLTP